jgi:lipopolysaccharide biosynthesis glycosyltransferase
MRVYIGHDGREQAAYDVAAKTARSFSCDVFPVYEETLRRSGMLTRPLDRRGLMWDLHSNAPQSTEFAISRFFVPLLAHSGWCLAVDCDVVFLEDPHELLEFADESKAVMVVKHAPLTATGTKMDGQVQTIYERKNWSSVVLWNVDHVANKRLNLLSLNQWPGRDLHAFKWLSDSEIGELPRAANWLVGVHPKPDRPIIAHYTLGVPAMPGHENDEYAHLWTEASQR